MAGVGDQRAVYRRRKLGRCTGSRLIKSAGVVGETFDYLSGDGLCSAGNCVMASASNAFIIRCWATDWQSLMIPCINRACSLHSPKGE